MDFSREEKNYEWLEVARSYEQELQSISLPSSSSADYWQKIGYCYELASRQTNNLEGFKNLRQLAVEAYEKANALFVESSVSEKQGKSSQCLALAECARSWLTSSPSEKQKALDKCHDLGKVALAVFENSGNTLEFGKTANILNQCLFDRLYIATTGEEVKAVSKEGIDNVELTITALSKFGNKNELICAFSWASLHTWYAANISELEKQAKTLAEKCVNYSATALELSKEVEDPYCKVMALWAETLSTLFFTDHIENSRECAKEMLEQASLIRDNYFIGIAGYLLAFVSDWTIPTEADPDKKRKRQEDILKYAEDAIRHLELVNQDTAIAETYLFYTESYSCLAREFATNLSDKLSFSRKALETGEKGLDYALRSGSLDALGSTLHALSKAYHYYSKLVPENEKKQQQLSNALGFRKEYLNTVQKGFESNTWILGVGLVFEAQIKADLAALEKGVDKITLLKEAISDMNVGVSYCKNWMESRSVPSLIAIVAGFEDAFAEMLYDSYKLTSDEENLKKANEVCRNAAEDFKKVDLPSRVAESYWKIARNLDLLSEYDQAAENFEKGFAGYKAAAQKISQFSDFFLDYASYMKAWSEIETAKLEHNCEKYGEAMNHYEKASSLMRQSKSWNYLSSNFYAWSLLEQAEDLSRKESCKESIATFENAIKFLQNSEHALLSQLGRIDKMDEQNLVKALIEASRIRVEYGHGRISLEEAKILDKQGDHRASSQKYGSAAEIFKKILQVDPGQTGKEVRPLVYLCQAWQKMTLAEAKNSPIMYEEAADLFSLANEHATKESSGLLALGHSSFCKALETGIEFEITRNASMYEETAKHIGSAASYYLRAGFESASDYAKGTQRLFDAYVYMDSAKREKDPSKEAKFYLMAEKVLQISAECFAKAGHTNKNEQVQRLLRKVRDDKELALSLSELFHAPAITSSTASFSALEPNEEKAVGLERFEHAEIQAKLIQHENEIKAGEDVKLEIQIVNVGKEPVLVTKIENILQAGFQVVAKPDDCSVEGTALTLKGRKIEPLKTDEIKIAFKSFIKGNVRLNPKIICVDETGHQMTHSPESIAFSFLDAALPGRVSTGFKGLDNLLLGGIPENYTIILTSPSCDEREELIKRFVQAGLTNGQITFYITTEVGNSAALAEKFQSFLFLFICNPRAEIIVKNLPNVFKMKGIENLTDIDIALTKSFRMFDNQQSGSKRACIEIISDVLLQHHAVITRKWLSGLLPELQAKGFTTLAVINPQMHPQEEVQAISGLFEGEIRITERETEKGPEKILRIRKLYNQRYVDTEFMLTRENLEI
ncbi:MAG: ATPase domain-containing protein [Candidatus Bathyarchaeia archaeon]|jgi:KaiC/GvpD/RAD55 family RecA-like ATPase